MKQQSDSDFRPRNNCAIGDYGNETRNIRGDGFTQALCGATPGGNLNPAHKNFRVNFTHGAEQELHIIDYKMLRGAETPEIVEKPDITKLHKVHKLHSEPGETPCIGSDS